MVVAISAKLDIPVPGSPVPQSLQTLAVVLVGAWLGPVLGAGALVLYAVLGGVGVPLFADGAAGWAHLAGPTAGYLAGFILAAGFVGWWCGPGRRPTLASVLLVMILAHSLILFSGWARLALMLGAAGAMTQGVSPFIVGGVAKSLAATAWYATVFRRTESHKPTLT